MVVKQSLLAFLVVCGIAARALGQVALPPNVEVRQVRGGLYQVVAGPQVTVFLVTPEGIILADPLNRPVALRIRQEIESRFPNASVRYVVYSHHHFDRAEGVSAFGTPQVVAHREFNQALDAARAALPSHINVIDVNLNRKYDPPEIAASVDGPLVLSKDRNNDGTVTPEELYAQVRTPHITYSNRLTLMLGGKSVQLIHPGPAYSPDNTILYFPDERIVFAADGPAVDVAPFSFGPFRPRDVETWIHALTSLEFDLLLMGNGHVVARSDLVALADYLRGIRSEAAAAYERGETLQRLRTRPASSSAATSPHAAGRSTQLAAVYRATQLLKVNVSGAAAAAYSRLDQAHCASYTFCAGGGGVPAVTASAALLSGNGAGVVAEATVEQQGWDTRVRQFYQEEAVFRQSRGSVLFRFSPRRDSPMSFSVVGGVSETIADRRGINYVAAALVPTGGRHAIHSRARRFGYTGGFDLTLGRRVAFTIPLRVTYTPSVPQSWPSRLAVSGGIGVTAQVFRHVW
jgi:glyoxylase-like metal-dependent hydrolase (beta-lactamase superfamily II)